MTSNLDRVDRELAAWIGGGPETGPADLLEAALAETRVVAQRPAWRVPSGWLPVPVSLPPAPRSLGMVFVAVALLVIVMIAILIAGSQRRLPPPFGPAANGLIAYDTGPGGGVWIADRDGANPRRVVGEGIERTPVFSPDGTRLAFWSRTNVPAESAFDVTFTLFVANADGSDPHRIAASQRFWTEPADAASWSPDSAHLTFSAAAVHGDPAQIWVVATDGSPAVPITSKLADRAEPAWSPNGEWIAFNELSGVVRDTHSIVLTHPDGTGTRVLHRQPVVGSRDEETGFGETIRWSPDSRSIAFNRGIDPMNPSETSEHAQYLAVLDAEGRGTERVVYTESSGWLHVPAWSPDGAAIAFQAGAGPVTLHVVDRDGSGDRVVVECPQQIDSLAWSPDGRYLTFACGDRAALEPVPAATKAVGVKLDAGARAIDIQRVAP
jgi:dipeptidyl aminopeptidase/acylaminoacyl peptidase